jgi:hypothetical protein
MTVSASANPVRHFLVKPMRPAQTGRETMRVMVLVKATEDSEQGLLKLSGR